MSSTFGQNTAGSSMEAKDNNASERLPADGDAPWIPTTSETPVSQSFLSSRLEAENDRTQLVAGASSEHNYATDIAGDSSDDDDNRTLVNDSRSPSPQLIQHPPSPGPSQHPSAPELIRRVPSPQPSQFRKPARTRLAADVSAPTPRWPWNFSPDSPVHTTSTPLPPDDTAPYSSIPQRVVLDLRTHSTTPTISERTRQKWPWLALDVTRLKLHFLFQKFEEQMPFGERVQWLIDDMYPTTKTQKYLKPPPGLFEAFLNLYREWENEKEPVEIRQPIRMGAVHRDRPPKRKQESERPTWFWCMFGCGTEASSGKCKGRTEEVSIHELREQRPTKRLRSC
ncbi:hypothetical protein D9758_011041 [Tetrapyrgos nigripes]|uniref:Uncharacterized protein n=1 Tax=Tetrapyrgos nigripes TaxID=182062 RepID=A0A8H5CU71_9AGAR|nr:hypothetical protein D9758_011041 [Tetrapyrgos nigripes]